MDSIRPHYDMVDAVVMALGNMELSERDRDVIFDTLRESGVNIIVNQSDSGFTWTANDRKSDKLYSDYSEAEKDCLIAGAEEYERSVRI